MAAIGLGQLLAMLKNPNPQVLVQQLIQQNFPNDPEMAKLLDLTNKGDINGVQQFAQQYFSQHGSDFNNEMTNLAQLLKTFG